MTFELKTDYIELFKLLKVMDITSSGGESKIIISEGQISVNNDVEYRKGYKVRKGDSISGEGFQIDVV